jgi:hypothetical protein
MNLNLSDMDWLMILISVWGFVLWIRLGSIIRAIEEQLLEDEE